jgi:hypothetical protein
MKSLQKDFRNKLNKIPFPLSVFVEKTCFTLLLVVEKMCIERLLISGRAKSVSLIINRESGREVCVLEIIIIQNLSNS